MNIISPFQNDRGAALVIALMFLAILGLLGSTAVVLTTTDIQIGGNYKTSEQAFYDADAGVNYGLAKMEQALKANPDGFLPTDIYDPTAPTVSSFVSLSGSPYTVPTGFNFSYQPAILKKIGDNAFSFTTVGNDPNNTGATATITATLKRKPAIEFGAFGDKKLDLGNTAAVYSYSHKDNPSPTAGVSTGEADVGSNEFVVLKYNSVIDGDVALGENTSGVDAILDDKGAIVAGINGEDIDRVDPDPLGVVGGDYAADFLTCSNAANNNNSLATRTMNYYTSSSIGVPTSLLINSKETVTLKGTPGGAKFYFTSIQLKSDSVLYIDTTLGAVIIYLTGSLDAINGTEIINLKETTSGGCGGAGTCMCCGPGPPNFTCDPYCFSSPYQIGAPSDFRIFANSQSSTDKISIGNSLKFSGVIYAPYITVRLDNSSDIYGAIIGKEVEVTNGVKIFFDVDTSEKITTTDLILTTWRDVRN